MGGCHDAPCDIVTCIMPRRHFLCFQQGALACAHVVVILLGRRCHGRIGKADDVRIVFEGALQAQGIGILVKGNGVFFAGTALVHHNARQTVFTLKPDEKVGKHRMTEDDAAGLVRHDITPVFPLRCLFGGLNDLVVSRTIRVGQDVEDVTGFMHVIFNAGFTGSHQFRSPLQVIGRQDQIFRRFVVVDVDIDQIVQLAAANAHEEARISFFIDKPVVLLVRAERVVEHFRGTMVFIEHRIEKAVAIRRPSATATGIFDHIGQIFAAGKITDAQIEIFRTLVVIAPDQPGMVMAVVCRRKAEIGKLAGLRIAIEQNLLPVAVSRYPKKPRLLAACHEACAIGIGAIRRWNG